MKTKSGLAYMIQLNNMTPFLSFIFTYIWQAEKAKEVFYGSNEIYNNRSGYYNNCVILGLYVVDKKLKKNYQRHPKKLED